MEPGLRRSVIGLAAVADDCGDGRDIDDAAPAGPDHRHQQRLRDVEKAVERDVDDLGPLIVAHARHHRIIVNASIVDDDLNRALIEDRHKGCIACASVGDVERKSFRSTAGCDDPGGNLTSALKTMMSMYINAVSYTH